MPDVRTYNRRVRATLFEVDYSRLEETAFTRARLQALSVAVVGAGALGNEAARLLGLLGTARVIVIDPDVVEPGNLPRSHFFRRQDAIGRNKASALVDAASVLFPTTAWTALSREVADVGLQYLTGVDALFSCVDSDLARLEISYLATRSQLPTIDAGLGRENHARGRVTYFPGIASAACYGCVLGSRRRRALLELWDSDVRPCGPEAGDADAPSTPTMAAITAALQVEIGLKQLFAQRDGGVSPARTVEIRLNPPGTTEFTIRARADCPFHDPRLPPRYPVSSPDTTIGEFLSAVGGEALMLDWPICVEARCLSCGNLWAPMQRLGALRRRGRCAACQSARVLELHSVREVDRRSPWSSVTPGALGLPPDHLFEVRGLPDR
jgi:molybdopterin-synthase adenylyltransferase